MNSMPPTPQAPPVIVWQAMVRPAAEIYMAHDLVTSFCAMCSAGLNSALLKHWICNRETRKADSLMMIAFALVNAIYAILVVPDSMYMTVGWQRNVSAPLGFTGDGIFWFGVPDSGTANAVAVIRICLLVERIMALSNPMFHRNYNKKLWTLLALGLSFVVAVISWLVYALAIYTVAGIGDCWIFLCYLTDFGVAFYAWSNLLFLSIASVLSVYFLYQYLIYRLTIEPELSIHNASDNNSAKKRAKQLNLIFAKQILYYLLFETSLTLLDVVVYYGYGIAVYTVLGPIRQTFLSVDSLAVAMIYANGLTELVSQTEVKSLSTPTALI